MDMEVIRTFPLGGGGCEEIELSYEELDPGTEGFYYRNPIAPRPRLVLDVWLGYDQPRLVRVIGEFLKEHHRAVTEPEYRTRPYLAVRHQAKITASA
jgi:hypothetical protein